MSTTPNSTTTTGSSSRPASNGRRRGGGGGDRDDPAVKFSKALSWLLRHGAVKEGVPIRPDGFVLVSDLLQHPKFRGKNLSDVQAAVRDSDKQRYQLASEVDAATGETVWMIKANQGHSIEVEVELEEVTDAAEIPTVLHGTSRSALPMILREGLSKMRRNHIHFAVGKPGESGVISGMRKSSEVIIYVDARRAMNAGIKFYRSPNNVVLSSGINGFIPAVFFDRIEDKNGNVIRTQ
ncbi:KptA family-domain-containing protein [Zopfochytrium polystomum]|nr:KptA family-domain-containing protein [Zopfochytrium polystomum]